MKKLISLILVITLCAAFVPASLAAGDPNGAAKFTDVKSTDWYYAYVDQLVKLGGIDGKTPTSFDPQGNMTTAEFLKAVMASCGLTQPSGKGHWAENYFSKALELGVIQDGEFPLDTWNKPITRQNMAKIIARASEIILKEAPIGEQEAEKLASANLDWADTCTLCKPYIAQSMAKGILVGTYQKRQWIEDHSLIRTVGSDGRVTLSLPAGAKETPVGNNFNGASNMTRAEAATAIVRLVDKSYRYTWYDGVPFNAKTDLVDFEGHSVINIDKAQQWLDQILASLKYTKEGSKYYLNVTFPELPEGYMVGFASCITRTQGNTIDHKTGWTMRPEIQIKSTGTIRQELTGLTSLSQVRFADVSFSIGTIRKDQPTQGVGNLYDNAGGYSFVYGVKEKADPTGLGLRDNVGYSGYSAKFNLDSIYKW